MDKDLKRSLYCVARFYDSHKVGDVGPLGFRRSTDLRKLLGCVEFLVDENILIPGEIRFLDLGCADGRVNVFFSRLAQISVGIEIDEWTLDEYAALRRELQRSLNEEDVPPLPENVFLFHGDSTDREVYTVVSRNTGLEFKDFDVFYTYLVMHEEFARMVADTAKPGAVFMVFGLHRILPRYPGLRRIILPGHVRGVPAVYLKE